MIDSPPTSPRQRPGSGTRPARSVATTGRGLALCPSPRATGLTPSAFAPSPIPASSVASGLASQLPGSVGRLSRPATVKLLNSPPANDAQCWLSNDVAMQRRFPQRLNLAAGRSVRRLNRHGAVHAELRGGADGAVRIGQKEPAVGDGDGDRATLTLGRLRERSGCSAESRTADRS